MAITPVASHGTEEGTWIPVNENEEAIPGTRYRLRMTVRAPYTTANIQKLEDLLRTGAGANNTAAWFGLREKIEIESFSASFPSGQTGSTPHWTFTTVFKKTSKGTPLAVIIGLIGLLITATIAFAVVGHVVEKEGDKIAKTGAATIFNPFFLIAAVIVVLAVSGRSLKSIGGT